MTPALAVNSLATSAFFPQKRSTMKDRKPLFLGLKSNFTEYLVSRITGHRHGCSDSGTPETLPTYSRFVNDIRLPALTPELQERLMGKAPLRLIRARTKTENYYEETLECGHAYTAYQSFLWDEGGHLINLEPSAKRRRCQECKAAALAAPKKPAQSVRAERKEKSA